MDTTESLRCKACDKLFSPTWYPEREAWEELCYECLAIAFDFDQLPDDYHDIINSYKQGGYNE